MQVFVGDTETYAHKAPLARPFETSQKFKDTLQITLKSLGKPGKKAVNEMSTLASLQNLYCNDALSNAEVMNAAKNADLIVGDSLDMCGSLIAARFSLPFVTVFTNSLSASTAHAYGLPLAPSYIPQFKSGLSYDQLNFVGRIRNVYQWILSYFMFYKVMSPPFQDLKDRYKIAPNKDLHEILNRVDLIIGQMGFFLDFARPVLPSK